MGAIQKTVKIRVGCKSPIPNARWCDPIGWEPANEFDGGEWCDGGWWWREGEEEFASLVWLGGGQAERGAEIEVLLDDLRVASCARWSDCRVIAKVQL